MPETPIILGPFAIRQRAVGDYLATSVPHVEHDTEAFSLLVHNGARIGDGGTFHLTAEQLDELERFIVGRQLWVGV